MTVVILSGPLGVGKSSLQRRLQAEYGFWTPTTHTTRPVGASESDLRFCDLASFEDAVRRGAFVMPSQFASNWYAWDAESLHRMRDIVTATVVNVRPYTGLVLAALLTQCVACWLWIDEDELSRRRSTRGEERDISVEMRLARERADETDRRYERFFPYRVRCDADALRVILTLAQDAAISGRSD
jgi:guanylate kinase